jgi:hypothetical protein
MKTNIFFYLIVLFVIISSCNNNSKKKNIAIKSEEVLENSKNIKSENQKNIGDSIEIPSFEIDLNLSEKAEKKLADDKETLIIIANLFGESKSDPNGEGPFSLAVSEIELTDSRKAIFKNIKYSKSDYDLIKGDIWITVNVISGRKSINKNFLDVDFLEEDLEKIINKKFILKGKLIEE